MARTTLAIFCYFLFKSENCIMRPLFILLLFAPFCAEAQKDSLKLVCPMQNAVLKSSKGAYKLNQPDMKIIFTSKTDTAFRAVIEGTVYNVSKGDENKYEVIMYHKDYYIWVIGIKKPLVKKGDNVIVGQMIGMVPPGDEIEFLLFKDELPLDPRLYLDCK